jgi:hypothetical protein
MPIFSEIEEGRADKKYNSPEIDELDHVSHLELTVTGTLLVDNVRI